MPTMVGVVGTHACTYLMTHDHGYLLNLVRPKVVIVDRVTLGNDYFWHVGRADAMVKVSGVWASPLEIQRALPSG